jgi:hypothetical protein
LPSTDEPLPGKAAVDEAPKIAFAVGVPERPSDAVFAAAEVAGETWAGLDENGELA